MQIIRTEHHNDEDWMRAIEKTKKFLKIRKLKLWPLSIKNKKNNHTNYETLKKKQQRRRIKKQN